MNQIQALFEFLIKSPLEFVLIGGFAAVLHGCNQTTRDIDVCLMLSPEHIRQLRETLEPLHPRHRMTADKLSFMQYPRDVTGLRNLYLETDLGVLDIVSHVERVGDFHAVLKNAETISLFGGTCRVISIQDLLQCKRALGRHRDLVVVEELQAILVEQQRR